MRSAVFSRKFSYENSLFLIKKASGRHFPHSFIRLYARMELNFRYIARNRALTADFPRELNLCLAHYYADWLRHEGTRISYFNNGLSPHASFGHRRNVARLVFPAGVNIIRSLLTGENPAELTSEVRRYRAGYRSGDPLIEFTSVCWNPVVQYSRRALVRKMSVIMSRRAGYNWKMERSSSFCLFSCSLIRGIMICTIPLYGLIFAQILVSL
jgi:hypothetical protein